MNTEPAIGSTNHQRPPNLAAFPGIAAGDLRRVMTKLINKMKSKEMACPAIFLGLPLLLPGSQGYGRGTDFDYGIAGTKGIIAALPVCRVQAPFSINHKFVFITTGRQQHDFFPESPGFFLHKMFSVVPVVKTSAQAYLCSIRSRQTKRHSPSAFIAIIHNPTPE